MNGRPGLGSGDSANRLAGTRNWEVDKRPTEVKVKEVDERSTETQVKGSVDGRLEGIELRDLSETADRLFESKEQARIVQRSDEAGLQEVDALWMRRRNMRRKKERRHGNRQAGLNRDWIRVAESVVER